MTTVIFMIDELGRVTMIDGAEGDGLVGRSIFDLYPASHAHHKNARRALAGESFGELVELGLPPVTWDTHWTPVRDADRRVTGAIGVAIDVTQQRRAEETLVETEVRLVEADRMANLGLLAAGVAHEINNPLTYVRLNLGRLVSLELSRTPLTPVRLHRLDLLRETREGIDRVEQIVRDLKRLARGGDATPERAPVELAPVLDSALRVVAHEIKHRACLVRDLARVPRVIADERRLAQVFLNLLVNAAQSIPEGEAHLNQIRVATRSAAGLVFVEIADTGTGIPPDNLKRIFEPFFTTKPGTGTGLGLSICQDIVTALGGEITVESVLGRGTTFRVILPAAPLDTAEAARATAELPAVQPRRRGRVLVIDDERSVALAVAQVLEERHEVRTASSGREAMAILQEDHDFDVILTDLMMPEVTGMDLHDALSLVDPEMAGRMIFMTGGAFTLRAHKFLAGVQNRRLEKPFDPTTLLEVIDSQLADAIAPAAPPRKEASVHAAVLR
jgi:signal transduction histidine kinase/CheY-like chemotaxis protein